MVGIGVGVAVGVLACGGATRDQTPLDSEGGADAAPADGGAKRDADAGPCCMPDPQPGCCMNYGGWRQPGVMCGAGCDGMPVPTDPDWKIEPDTHGCPRWTNPHDYFGGGTMSSTVAYCGAYQPSGGVVDAGDAGDAADSD
jgi:hypothetical protein